MTPQKTSAFVDAHCHIDLFPVPAEVVKEAEAGRIYTLAVTNAPSVFPHTAALCSGSKFVRPALGLHPELISSHGHELAQFQAHLLSTRYIGEVGLDYVTQDKELRLRQRRVLETIAGWANEAGDKVLTIHSRRAVSDVLAILKGAQAHLILHWFSGTNKELERAIAEGFFFSINGAMMESAKSIALVDRIPKDRVLTETDGPFTKDGASAATPRAVKAIVRRLAELWRLPEQDVQAMVLQNLRELLGAGNCGNAKAFFTE